MKRWSKVLIAAALAAGAAVPTQTANAWWGWGGPGYTQAIRYAYKYDPAYWYAPPAVRSDIRRVYRYRARGYPGLWW